MSLVYRPKFLPREARRTPFAPELFAPESLGESLKRLPLWVMLLQGALILGAMVYAAVVTPGAGQ